LYHKVVRPRESYKHAKAGSAARRKITRSSKKKPQVGRTRKKEEKWKKESSAEANRVPPPIKKKNEKKQFKIVRAKAAKSGKNVEKSRGVAPHDSESMLIGEGGHIGKGGRRALRTFRL